MGRRTVPLNVKKDADRHLLFLEGMQHTVPLGPGWKTPKGERVNVVAVGLHDRAVIGAIHPEALKLKGPDVTSVAYRFE